MKRNEKVNNCYIWSPSGALVATELWAPSHRHAVIHHEVPMSVTWNSDTDTPSLGTVNAVSISKQKYIYLALIHRTMNERVFNKSNIQLFLKIPIL